MILIIATLNLWCEQHYHNKMWLTMCKERVAPCAETIHTLEQMPDDRIVGFCKKKIIEDIGEPKKK